MDMLACLPCLHPTVTKTTLRQCRRIALAMVIMTGRMTITPELGRIKHMIDALRHLLAAALPLTSLVLDGHFGTHNALHMARQCHVHLLSKRRADSALYWPYIGPSGGRGPRRKYGDKVDYAHIPAQYLKEITEEGQIETRISQAQLLHKECAQPLNVALIVKTNLRTQARAHVILFSSDLALDSASLVDYYRLRFHIEFNFRDAKQDWGLEDFMRVTPAGVTNAANMSLFMVNVAYRLRADVRVMAAENRQLAEEALVTAVEVLS